MIKSAKSARSSVIGTATVQQTNSHCQKWRSEGLDGCLLHYLPHHYVANAHSFGKPYIEFSRRTERSSV